MTVARFFLHPFCTISVQVRKDEYRFSDENSPSRVSTYKGKRLRWWLRSPDMQAAEQLVPYIILRLITGSDEQTPGESPTSECKVRVIAVTYSKDDSQGALDALNVITRIRIALLKSGVVGQFLIKPQIEYLMYENDTSPYHIGEMMLTAEMPTVTREGLFS